MHGFCKRRQNQKKATSGLSKVEPPYQALFISSVFNRRKPLGIKEETVMRHLAWRHPFSDRIGEVDHSDDYIAFKKVSI